MEQVGYITKILPEDKCKVLISRISGCKGTCKTCGGCPTPTMHIVMKKTLDVSVGDYVKIGVDSSVVLKYSIFLSLLSNISNSSGFLFPFLPEYKDFIVFPNFSN